MKALFRITMSLLIALALHTTTYAQLDVSAQFRTRSEFRDGQGTLPVVGQTPAFFTSQRTRLNVGFTKDRIKIFTTLQDVRVWGQDVSQINRYTPEFNMGLMLHEAWMEAALSDTSAFLPNASLKAGRQEIIYNDHRLLGNLDWLQQARRHDAVVFKVNYPNLIFHLGAAFNQNNERKHGTAYHNIPGAIDAFSAGYPVSTNQQRAMYKSMQYLYAKRNLNIGHVNFLFFKDDFSKYDIEEGIYTFRQGTWSRFTTGLNSELEFFNKNLYLNSSLYYQGGKDMHGNQMNAWMASVYSTIKATSTLSFGPGVDYLTGNNGDQTDGVNRAFDPLYGTPHKFWGLMDYFYVADPFGRAGLMNYYLRTRKKVSDNLVLTLDLHEFRSDGRIVERQEGQLNVLSKRLGTEADFIVNYKLFSNIALEGAYCMFFGTESLKSIKPPFVPQRNVGHWAYLMLTAKI